MKFPEKTQRLVSVIGYITAPAFLAGVVLQHSCNLRVVIGYQHLVHLAHQPPV